MQAILRWAIPALFVAVLPLPAQDDHGLTPADIERGGQIYFANCASCHGPDGDGVATVNLGSNRFRRASSDRDLIGIVRNGIPGTPMPPGNYSDAQAALIVAYLHSMAKSPTTLPASAKPGDASAKPGDPLRGQTVLRGKGQCLNCHRLNGTGGFLGPDLSEIGNARRAADLQGSLLDPNAGLRSENRTLRAVRRDGGAISARLLDQDTYSLQILDGDGRLRSLDKAALREFEIMKTSVMPAYQDKLSAQEAADVVSYLVTLKGARR